jgi:hypothetical protein
VWRSRRRASLGEAPTYLSFGYIFTWPITSKLDTFDKAPMYNKLDVYVLMRSSPFGLGGIVDTRESGQFRCGGVDAVNVPNRQEHTPLLYCTSEYFY